MALYYHPEPGTTVVCDLNSGFKPPEMVKRRPAIIVSPRLKDRPNLCTIVPLSTTAPKKIKPYHYKLHVTPLLPKPYHSPFHWVKGDMLLTISFQRLFLPFNGKDGNGKRIYDVRVIDKADLIKIQKCILHSLGLSSLTDYL